MVTVSNLNSVISIDPETNQVTVGAGMRVSDLVEKLKPYGLTLQNFASIAEQQVGGITQVSAHGTGNRRQLLRLTLFRSVHSSDRRASCRNEDCHAL